MRLIFFTIIFKFRYNSEWMVQCLVKFDNWREFFEGAILITAILIDSVRIRRRELLIA